MCDERQKVDFQEGLVRLGGNETLYYSLLQMFIDEHHNSLDYINQQLNDNNIDETKFRVHAIKGASVNLGAISLYTAAIEFENQLKQSQSSDVQSKLELFSNELTYFINEIKFLLD